MFPLPNEATLPRSMFSKLPSNEVLSSNSLQEDMRDVLMDFLSLGIFSYILPTKPWFASFARVQRKRRVEVSFLDELTQLFHPQLLRFD